MRLMNSVPAQHEPEIAAYVDLDFVPEAGRVEKLGRLLPALVFVNAVTPTLKEIGRPFVRINVWPGFATRQLHELVAPDEATKQRLATFYSQVGCEYRLAPDIPGMISARVVAGIINEAWYAWEEKVSTREEIDTAMRLGTNYPLGPFEWGERIGLEQIARLLWSLSKTDPRYMPSKALAEQV
jgi:3-hydroxybutyryl-CoA dehydrogenase